MNDLDFVAYCGLYCGLCSARNRIPSRAQALREAMVKEGYDSWGVHLENYKEFRAFLERLCDLAKSCPGCRAGGGPPFCGIRKCAQAKGIDVCVFCEEYPCHRIKAIAKGYPTLIPDGERLREKGIKAWVREQEDRRKTGFAYADIRCYPYEVPSE